MNDWLDFKPTKGSLLDIVDSFSRDYESGLIGEEQLVNKIIRVLRAPNIINFDKTICINKGETWVQEILYNFLSHKLKGNIIHRERVLGNLGRIDFKIGDVGIEVKIFRSQADFDRLNTEMLKYTEVMKKIVIPYLTAGGLPPNKLNQQMKLLRKKYPQIKGYFELNVGDNNKSKINSVSKQKRKSNSRNDDPFDIRLPEIKLPDIRF